LNVSLGFSVASLAKVNALDAQPMAKSIDFIFI